MALRFSYEYAPVDEGELREKVDLIKRSYRTIIGKDGPGGEYLGWFDLPEDYDRDEFSEIKMAGERIRKDSQALLVIGIGGSYLGARAVITSLRRNFPNTGKDSDHLEIYYAGNNLSPTYIVDLLNHLRDKDLSINVISKSGTTTEPAIAFRIFKEFMEEKYGKDGARKRIYVTTDKKRGALRDLAKQESYETFIIPDDIGGRYSVLTAVGLLPIAASGLDIDELMKGAQKARQDGMLVDFDKNYAFQYAALRNIQYEAGKKIEILTSYSPELYYIKEWWKQLFGESEGKDGKGIFPSSLEFTTDLHSMGQMIQEGERNIFETNLLIAQVERDILVKEDQANLDGLNYLAGKSLSQINNSAFEGTLKAHTDGGVPNLIIELDRLDEYNIGYLLFFFQLACGLSAYSLGVNPFNQPGVEAYKTNMFHILGKEGY